MSDRKAELIRAADQLRQVETAYYTAVDAWMSARLQCDAKEAQCIQNGEVTMRNPDSRNADLWRLCATERRQVREAERKVDALKAELHYRQNVLHAYFVVAQLEGKEAHPWESS